MEKEIKDKKVDGLGSEEIKILTRLKEALGYSINSIEEILNNENVESNLRDLLRDWNVDKYERNSVIRKDLEILEECFKQMSQEG